MRIVPIMAAHTDCPDELEAHLANAHAGMGCRDHRALSVEEIEAFAKLVGTTPKTFFRLGYGFTRQRNGTHNMHAALCIASVLGVLAARGRWRLPHQRSDLPLGQDA